MSRSRVLGGALVLAVLAGLLYLGGLDDGGGPTVVAPAPRSSAGSTPAPASGERDAGTGLRLVDVGSLPREAQQTLDLVERGGPFPYERDGAVFANRERLLPARASGHYREYTVPTPGSADRGARRIVTGGADEVFYTADHYGSFVRVRR